ncbi:MAG: rubrerythrin family protein [Desulfobacterales bacterium]
MAKTIDNLTKMFSSGAESTIRYLAFAEAADREGHLGVAKIFRTVAKAKMFHALSHFRAAKKVDITLENLKQAREEESYDYQSACPVMVKDATAEGALEARHSLEYAMSIGPIITRLIGKAIGNPDLHEDSAYFVCPVCGYIEFGSAPDKCPYCGVDSSRFVGVQ